MIPRALLCPRPNPIGSQPRVDCGAAPQELRPPWLQSIPARCQADSDAAATELASDATAVTAIRSMIGQPPKDGNRANPGLGGSTGLTDLAFVAFVIEALTSLLGMIISHAIVAGIIRHKLTPASRGKKPRASIRVAGD